MLCLFLYISTPITALLPSPVPALFLPPSHTSCAAAGSCWYLMLCLFLYISTPVPALLPSPVPALFLLSLSNNPLDLHVCCCCRSHESFRAQVSNEQAIKKNK